jgi:hypothetical protein
LGGHLFHTRAVGARQQDPGALRHALGRLAVPPEVLEFNDIFPLQLDRLGFAAAHGFAP